MKKEYGLVCILGLLACNYDVGECYVRGEQEPGVGGGLPAPTGSGGFGSVPLEPQSGVGDWDPCSNQLAECTVTWKAGSTVCQQQGVGGTCTTLYQGAHSSLEEAKSECERIGGADIGSDVQSCGPCQWVMNSSESPVEKCKKLCDKINIDCIARCPKGNKECMHRCNLDYSECLKDCGK